MRARKNKVRFDDELSVSSEDSEFSNIGTDVVNTSYELGVDAVSAVMTVANNVANLTHLMLDSEEVTTVKQEGKEVADLIFTMSKDAVQFDGKWSNDNNDSQAVEVDFDGTKDTIVSSHAIEASFFDPSDRAIESVHVVPVKLKSKSSRRKRKLAEKAAKRPTIEPVTKSEPALIITRTKSSKTPKQKTSKSKSSLDKSTHRRSRRGFGMFRAKSQPVAAY